MDVLPRETVSRVIMVAQGASFKKIKECHDDEYQNFLEN